MKKDSMWQSHLSLSLSRFYLIIGRKSAKSIYGKEGTGVSNEHQHLPLGMQILACVNSLPEEETRVCVCVAFLQISQDDDDLFGMC
jgi:hypothetical protein